MKNLFTFIIFFSLFSCQQNTYFNEATPPGIPPIESIPVSFQGTYMCESDSSYIFANERLIYQESYHAFIATLDQIEDTEDCSIQSGGIYIAGRQECIPFEYIDEETITAKIYDIDTLFNFNNNQVAKVYKGRLFLNFMNKHQEWSTFMISPEPDGSLMWELIDIPEKSLDSIPLISPNYKTRLDKDDEVKYILRPNLIEFDQILEKKYTVECDRLQVVNLEH
jgi:hypothetical protein